MIINRPLHIVLLVEGLLKGAWTLHIDGPGHLYGFGSKLKHRIFGKIVEKLSTDVVKC